MEKCTTICYVQIFVVIKYGLIYIKQFNCIPLIIITDYNAGDFSWDTYLNETKSSAVPARAFKPVSGKKQGLLVKV